MKFSIAGKFVTDLSDAKAQQFELENSSLVQPIDSVAAATISGGCKSNVVRNAGLRSDGELVQSTTLPNTFGGRT